MTPQEELLLDSLERVLNDPGVLSEASGVRAAATRVYVGSLSEMSAAQVCGAGELVAGVLARFAGRFSQVALFAMEPEEAYELVRHELGGDDPLGSYAALGGELARAAALAVDPLGVTQEGSPTLQEDSVIGTLLRTHAPSDTAVVSVELQLSWPGREASRIAHVYVLADPKPFAAAIAAA